MARAKPSRELSTTRPCRSLLGANAMECSTKSSWPQRCAMASNTASIWPGCSTSSGNVMAACSCCASDSTCGRALSLNQVTASSAPASRKARAQPQAMLLSLAMPTTSPFLPCRAGGIYFSNT